MSLRNSPTRQSDSDGSVVSLLIRAVDGVKSHLENWPERYVEMRTDAIERRHD